MPKSCATEEHQNNQQVDKAAKTGIAQRDLDWVQKGELFIAQWAHETSGHLGRDATYRWACDQGTCPWRLSYRLFTNVKCAAIKRVM